MSYGLDLSEVRYETDHLGNRLKAIIPLRMFSALTEFWTAARRAQTASIEASARPGQYKGSLHAVTPSGSPETEAPMPAASSPVYYTPPPSRHGGKTKNHESTWEQLLEAMPPEGELLPGMSSAPPQLHTAHGAPSIGEPLAAAHGRGRPDSGRTRQVVFVREFVQAPPDEVMQQVRAGVYFLKAWRTYRRLTLRDVADLFGKTVDAINWHEHGYSRPNAKTLARFAEILDCPLEQLTATPGSNTQPWLTVISQPAPKDPVEARAPDDTDYPDVVLAHLIAGKTPLTAWRLHRGMTIAQLADAYGCTARNIKQLEEAQCLRRRTIEKLCPVLKCKAPQLLRPESMPVPDVPVRVSSRKARAGQQAKRLQQVQTGFARTA